MNLKGEKNGLDAQAYGRAFRHGRETDKDFLTAVNRIYHSEQYPGGSILPAV